MDDKQLAYAVDDVERALAPAGGKAAIALLAGRLFAVLPMPPVPAKGPNPMAIWVEHLERFPADVLARAVDAVIARHKWPRPPAIADVVEACEQDAEYSRRRAALVNARILRMKPVERAAVELSDEERALEHARRMAVLEAYRANHREPMDVLAKAVTAAFENATRAVRSRAAAA